MQLTYENIFVLIAILTIHNILINDLEKIFFAQLRIPSFLRPSVNCKYLINNWTTECLGMPSGHAQLISILSYILYKYNYISIELASLAIIIICAQRVIFKKHTILQVCVGVLFGLFYGQIYTKSRLTFSAICIPILFVIFIILITFAITDDKDRLNSKQLFWIKSIMATTK